MNEMKEHDKHEMNNDDTVNQANDDISTEGEEYVAESNPVDNDGFPEEEDYLPEGTDYVAKNTGVEHREEPASQEGVKYEENLEVQKQEALSEETKPQEEPAQSSDAQTSATHAPTEGSHNQVTPTNEAEHVTNEASSSERTDEQSTNHTSLETNGTTEKSAESPADATNGEDEKSTETQSSTDKQVENTSEQRISSVSESKKLIPFPSNSINASISIANDMKAKVTKGVSEDTQSNTSDAKEGKNEERKDIDSQVKNNTAVSNQPPAAPQSTNTSDNTQPQDNKSSSDKESDDGVVADAKAQNKSNTMSNQEFIEKLIELEKLSKAETDREKEFKQLLQEMREEQQKRSETIQKVNEEAQEVITFMQNECGYSLDLSDPVLYELLFIKKTFAATLNDYRETLSNATAKLDEKIVRILAFTEAVDKQQANFINSITAEYVQQKKAVEQSMDNAKESIGDIIEEAVLKANKEAQNAENQAVEEFTSSVNQKITDEFKFFKYLLYGTLALSIIGIFV